MTKDYASPLPTFTERELNLIENCIMYSTNDPAGLPGHNLMIIVDKLEKLLTLNGISLEQN